MKIWVLAFLIVATGILGGCSVEEVEMATFPSYASVTRKEQTQKENKMQRDIAMWYHCQLRKGVSEGELKSAYDSILFYENGVMGTLTLSEQSVSMPIYHGVSANVLEKGAGHMPSSAFPIGEKGSVSILVIAEGAEITAGEHIEISIAGEKTTYVVTQVDVESSDIPTQSEETLLVIIFRGERSTRSILCGIDTSLQEFSGG